MSGLCGGIGDIEDADQETQQVLESVRASVESKAGKSFSELTAVKVTRQVVAGINYFVKAHIGNQEYIHVRIYQPLPGQGDNECHGIQSGKGLGDALDYFQD